MKRIVLGGALVAGLITFLVVPVGAAPTNSPKATSFDVDCGDGSFQILSLDNQSVTAFADGGVFVAREVHATGTITVALDSDQSVIGTGTEPFDRTAGQGDRNAELLSCDFASEFSFGPFPLDADTAAQFLIDPSYIGQNVVFTSRFAGTALVMPTGKK